MNQFINGGPWSCVDAGEIYSFIKQCLQHLSSPKSRPSKNVTKHPKTKIWHDGSKGSRVKAAGRLRGISLLL